MSLANHRSEVDGVPWRIWPADRTGDILVAPEGQDATGATPRPMDATELAAWDESEDRSSRQADSDELPNDFEAAKVHRDEAQQSRADMDPAGPPIARWVPVDETAYTPLTGSGNQVTRLVALEARVNEMATRANDVERLANHIIIELRRVYGDLRQNFATWVRKLRADRNDAAA